MSKDTPDDIFARQSLRLQYLKKFKVNSIDKVRAEKRTLTHLTNRLNLLEDYWVKFLADDALLAPYATNDDYKDKDYFEDDFFQGEFEYISVKTLLQDEINKLLPQNVGDTSQSPRQELDVNTLNVPSIASHSTPNRAIPQFGGSQEEWDSWRALFTAMVINDNRLPDAIKLQHLLSCVHGPAKVALGGVSVSSSDFNVAWEKLLRRYDISKHKLFTYLDNFIELPQISHASAAELSLLIDRAEEIVKGLTELKCPVDHYDIWFVHMVERKLDDDTRLSWAIHEEGVSTFSTYKNLLKFLECRITSLKVPQSHQKQTDNAPLIKNTKRNTSDNSCRQTVSNVAQEVPATSGKFKGKSKSKFTCLHCDGNHSVFRCKKFLGLDAEGRLKLIKLKKLCEVCFSSKHATADCPRPEGCPVDSCRGKHNALLHKTLRSYQSHTTVSQVDAPGSNASQIPANCAFTAQSVLLATAKICLSNKFGDKICVNALIDPGSMRSFVSRKVVTALNLETTPVDIGIKGIGDVPTAVTKNFCRLTLSSNTNSNFTLEFSALVLGQLTSQLPPREIKVSNWPHLQQLELADPKYMSPKHIDCIVGADTYPRIILEGMRVGPENSPMAQNSKIGWLVLGLACPPVRDCINSCFSQQVDAISDALVQMWHMDQIPKKTFLTPEEAECEKHFVDTVFKVEGRYGVRLPFKIKPFFPGSRQIAIQALNRLQSRLAKNLALRNSYNAFMQEYLDLKHLELIPDGQIDKPEVYYIPHHPVFHNGKIRVVFNASAPAFNNLSLNKSLHTGQKLQQDMVSVLIRWRCFKTVFTCDIVKMFRQILIDSRDRDWLRIIYDFGTGIQHFRLCTVTYGTVCAPFQSLRVLLEIVKECQDHLPEVAAAIRENCYVDDFFCGADTWEDTIEIRDKLIAVLKSAGIELSKWAANDKRVLNNLSNVDQNERTVNFSAVTSTLGLKWSPLVDTFTFALEVMNTKPTVTKRVVLSEASKLFDPLGWVSPILVCFKTFLQDLWIDGLDWDTPLSSELGYTWDSVKSRLRGIDTIKIPRWLGCKADTRWSLHGFSDASKRAYAACIYYVPEVGTPALVCAKTKVAPVNTISITKLELSAAHLLAKLIEYVLPAFTIKPLDIHCWSDSRNVLCMLKLAPAKLKVFEANRVSDVITKFPNVRWKYVPTRENPADCATRGLSAQELSDFTLWWAGPAWIQSEANWPNQLDLESNYMSLNASLVAEKISKSTWLGGFSSFSRLTRVIARGNRWLPKWKVGRSETDRLQVLTAQELEVAGLQILKLDQELHFAKELGLLRSNKLIPRRSKLARLKPFLDNKGLIRMGSRLENCPFLTYEEKFPIILDRHSSVARMLVRDYHKMYLHGGPQLILSAISRKYFIICGVRVIKSVLCKCPTCLRYSGRCMSQQMAPLPRDRLTFTYPFAATGLDYAGPIKVTPSRGRGITSTKGYICIFVCLATRATHIEIVSDLTSRTFLAAFDRFTNRRGLPHSIRSDNGTTFVGAEREIAELFKETSSFFKQVQEYANNIGITWTFSPPYGPHFGGIWEAAVKSFKFHYKRVLGETPLTFEEHSTLSAQIEGCLNSRPICTISPDSRDQIPLTPGHFLIGRPIRVLPPSSDVSDPTKSYAERLTLLLAMRNCFWQTWKKEVLHQLMQFNKWHFPKKNLGVGDIVILKDETSPPAHWPLGKVVNVETDRFGLVRVASVKTENSTLVRPIHKLIYLPASEQALQTYVSYQALLSEPVVE